MSKTMIDCSLIRLQSTSTNSPFPSCDKFFGCSIHKILPEKYFVADYFFYSILLGSVLLLSSISFLSEHIGPGFVCPAHWFLGHKLKSSWCLWLPGMGLISTLLNWNEMLMPSYDKYILSPLSFQSMASPCKSILLMRKSGLCYLMMNYQTFFCSNG